MGTRADFYIGRGTEAEWIGSIAWDGYPSGIEKPLLSAETEDAFKNEFEKFCSSREDVTLPKDGWPWPWNDSGTTDFAYAFDAGKVWASAFGSAWRDPLSEQSEWEEGVEAGKVSFPDMSKRANVALGSKKSGLILVGG